MLRHWPPVGPQGDRHDQASTALHQTDRDEPSWKASWMSDPALGSKLPPSPTDDAVAQGTRRREGVRVRERRLSGRGPVTGLRQRRHYRGGRVHLRPGSATSPTTAFTFTAGAYQILTVPGSTASIATGINTAGLIGGAYGICPACARLHHQRRHLQQCRLPRRHQDPSHRRERRRTARRQLPRRRQRRARLPQQRRHLHRDRLPGATSTAAAGINTSGDIVGAGRMRLDSHGLLLQAGVFTPIDFPLATSTTAFGINDTGEIAGFYNDAAGTITASSSPAGRSAPWTSPAPGAPT